MDTWSGTTTEPGHAELLTGYGPDQLYQEFLGNMQRLGLQDTVVPIRSNTLSAARQWQHGTSISLLYIDASHEYANVRADFEHWSPNVVDGGVIVFDDVPSWPGPTRLVTELPSWYLLGQSHAQSGHGCEIASAVALPGGVTAWRILRAQRRSWRQSLHHYAPRTQTLPRKPRAQNIRRVPACRGRID